MEEARNNLQNNIVPESTTGLFEKKLQMTTLPSMAKLLLPSALKEETKALLAERPDMEAILVYAITSIEKGSVETVETLVRKNLKCKE